MSLKQELTKYFNQTGEGTALVAAKVMADLPADHHSLQAAIAVGTNLAVTAAIDIGLIDGARQRIKKQGIFGQIKRT